MTARFCVRPVAKAFGTSESAMPTRGFSMSAIAQIRSTIACSCGACSGVTTTARMADMASESENHHCPPSRAALMTSTNTALTPMANSTAARMTYRSPMPTRVPPIRAESPRSDPYRVRAMQSA